MIRTLRGSGYRFVADVLVEGGDATENAAERIISHARISLEAAVSSIVSCAEYRIG
jgi:DNA-binding winged helix-turn-helix (wHTH) protein